MCPSRYVICGSIWLLFTFVWFHCYAPLPHPRDKIMEQLTADAYTTEAEAAGRREHVEQARMLGLSTLRKARKAKGSDCSNDDTAEQAPARTTLTTKKKGGGPRKYLYRNNDEGEKVEMLRTRAPPNGLTRAALIAEFTKHLVVPSSPPPTPLTPSPLCVLIPCTHSLGMMFRSARMA